MAEANSNSYAKYLDRCTKECIYVALFGSQQDIQPKPHPGEFWLSSSPEKVERGAGYGYNLIQGWPDAVYWYSYTGCAGWSQKLMAISTGPYVGTM